MRYPDSRKPPYGSSDLIVVFNVSEGRKSWHKLVQYGQRNRSALEPRAAGGPSTQVTPLIASGPSKVPARDVESTNMFGAFIV